MKIYINRYVDNRGPLYEIRGDVYEENNRFLPAILARAVDVILSNPEKDIIINYGQSKS